MRRVPSSPAALSCPRSPSLSLQLIGRLRRPENDPRSLLAAPSANPLSDVPGSLIIFCSLDGDGDSFVGEMPKKRMQRFTVAFGKQQLVWMTVGDPTFMKPKPQLLLVLWKVVVGICGSLMCVTKGWSDRGRVGEGVPNSPASGTCTGHGCTVQNPLPRTCNTPSASPQSPPPCPPPFSQRHKVSPGFYARATMGRAIRL